MSPILVYLATLVVYFFIYNIFGFGLNIQFGYAGILDFAFITFMAVGGYLYGAAALPHETPGSQIYYVLGLSWSFPLALLLGILGAGAVGALVGLIALKRLRSDYLAIVTLASGTLIYGVIGNFTRLFDGWEGLMGVPQPFTGALNLNANTFVLFFVLVSGVIMAILWFFANRLYRSPLGRAMRAVREDIDVAEAYGKNAFKLRMTAMVIGCIYAGIGGALTIAFITALAPAGWSTGETFVIWALLLIGGRGNNLGAVVGSFLVAVLFTEATRYLPAIGGNPNLIPDLRNIVIGVLLIVTLRFRPQGLVPEPKTNFFAVPLTSRVLRRVRHEEVVGA
ncbi:MAG: branched-chain amino acid ABC transporter permease [Actinomycetes bacterium]